MLGRLKQAFTLAVIIRITRLALGLVVSMLLLRYLGREGFGKVFVSMAFITPLLCIAELGLTRLTVRELTRHPEAEGRILGTTLALRFLTGLAAFIFCWLASFITGENHLSLVLIYSVLLITHAITEFHALMEARGRVVRAMWLQFAGGLTGLSLAAAGIWYHAPVEWFAAAYVIECWVAATLIWRSSNRLRVNQRLQWDGQLARKLWRESRFELVAQLGLLLLLRLDGVMLGWLGGDVAAGEYGAAVRISEVVYFIAPTLASVTLSPLVQLQSTDPTRYRERFSDYLATNLLIALLCASALWLAADFAIRIVAGGAFTNATHMLRILAWAAVPYFVGVARTQYLATEGKLEANLTAVILGVLVNVGLNILWIPIYGGEGAAWATLIAYSVAWIGSSVLRQDLWPVISLHWKGLKRLPQILKQLRTA
ncbi:MAG: flippase [Verrucomicrobiaceae bacterium]|nr:flippase [Verrucomicrobiaceae bacterium]